MVRIGRGYGEYTEELTGEAPVETAGVAPSVWDATGLFPRHLR
jgi:hypothetical protein